MATAILAALLIIAIVGIVVMWRLLSSSNDAARELMENDAELVASAAENEAKITELEKEVKRLSRRQDPETGKFIGKEGV